jgi:hypothetical protein
MMTKLFIKGHKFTSRPLSSVRDADAHRASDSHRTSLKAQLQSCLASRRGAPTKQATAARPAGPVVTAQMMTFMKTGNAVMATVKALLPLGPVNQIFSNVDPNSPGRARLAAATLGEANAVLLPQLAKSHHKVMAQYVASHPLLKAVNPSVAELEDPQLLKLAVASGTGVCNVYACLTALLTAQALYKQGKPFEILVVTVEGPKGADPGLNAPHAFTVVRPVGDDRNAQAVVLDSWVQNSVSRPLMHTSYGNSKHIHFSKPELKIVNLQDGTAPQTQFFDRYGQPHANLDFATLPTQDDYRAVQGAMSRQHIESFIESSPQREELSAQWQADVAQVQNLYADGGAMIATAPRDAFGLSVFQAANNAAPDAPTLYRTPCASQTLDVNLSTSTFPGAAGIPVAPNVQETANQYARTTAPQRSEVNPKKSN